MFKELDCVILKSDISGTPLRAGMLGAIVIAYPNSDCYEVEFMDSATTFFEDTFTVPGDLLVLSPGKPSPPASPPTRDVAPPIRHIPPPSFRSITTPPSHSSNTGVFLFIGVVLLGLSLVILQRPGDGRASGPTPPVTSVAPAPSIDSFPARPILSPDEVQTLDIGAYHFEAHRQMLSPGFLEIVSNGHLLTRLIGDAFYIEPQWFQAPPAWHNGTDLTGDGIPEVIVVESSGGSRCCTTWHVFSVGPTLLTVPIPKDTSMAFPFSDVDGDGIYEVTVSDRTFDSWNGVYGESPSINLIFAYRNGTYQFDPEMMRKPALSEDELRQVASEVNWSEERKPPTLWANALNLITTGNAAQVRQYFELAWPDNRPGMNEFIAEFYEQLGHSLHLNDLKALNGGLLGR